MNVLLEGDLVTFFVTVIILIDTFKQRVLEETLKDTLFRHFSVAGFITIIFGTVRAAATMILSNLSPSIIRLFTNFQCIALLATLYLWLIFALENTYEEHVIVKILGKYTKMILGVFIFIALLEVIENVAIPLEAKNFTLAILTGLWLCGVLAIVLSSWKIITPPTKRTLTIIPLILTAAIFAFLTTGNHLFINTAISVAMISTYLIIMNRRFSIDPLTDTMTRSAFIRTIARHLPSFSQGAVIVADIENFKYFNQKFGQQNGDRLLRKIGKFFTFAAQDNSVYRYGGDQFALILHRVDTIALADILKVISQRFEAAWEIGDASAKTNIRLAIVNFSHNFKHAEEMIHAIDLTLAKAKTGSPTEIAYYSTALSTKHKRQHDVESAVRYAIEHKTLKVVYQPIFETDTLNIYSAEALARLDDPYLGPISPVEFIPIAETTGLIVDLTYEVLRQVCEVWNLLKNTPTQLHRIAINLSAINFLEPHMEERLLSTIRRYGVSPANIKFELTESMIVHSFDRVKRAMDYMADQEISFSLDDYGKGYSNLDSLISLPFTTVKLDRSIVQACQTNFTYIEAIVLMLNRMGKKIVGEGIETEEQLAQLTQAGANRVQGFLFARPMSKEKLIAYLKRSQV